MTVELRAHRGCCRPGRPVAVQALHVVRPLRRALALAAGLVLIVAGVALGVAAVVVPWP